MTTVREMIEGLGGFEAIRQRSEEFRQVVDFFASQEKFLVKEHPHKWVAVTKDKALVFGDSLEDVLAKAEREGFTNSDILVRHLDPNPPALLL